MDEGREGYEHLQGVLGRADIDDARRAFREDGTVDHRAIQRFVDGVLLPAARLAHCSYAKFRASDYSNAVDASCLHRDLIACDAARPLDDVRTLLCYLDDSDMELLPGSHGTLAMTLGQLLTCPARRLHLEVGDALHFHSCLLHRGLFGGQQRRKKRRLIQVFDVTAEPLPMLHVPGQPARGGLMMAATRVPPLLLLFNALGYLNAATGYGALGFAQTYGAAYLSSEGHSARAAHLDDATPNVYVCTPGLRDLPERHRASFAWRHYGCRLAFFSALLLALVLATALVSLVALRSG